MNTIEKNFRHYYFRELIAQLDEWACKNGHAPFVLTWTVARKTWAVATRRANGK